MNQEQEWWWNQRESCEDAKDLYDLIPELVEESARRELEWVLDHCSGGGDWRRKITQRLETLK